MVSEELRNNSEKRYAVSDKTGLSYIRTRRPNPRQGAAARTGLSLPAALPGIWAAYLTRRDRQRSFEAAAKNARKHAG